MIMQAAKGKNKSRNVFAAGFKFTEGTDKRFQWEINEAIEMATSAQVSLPSIVFKLTINFMLLCSQ